MGQFIETQSQLVSEAKQARLEREQQKSKKKNIEYIKNKLKLYFETTFNTLSLYDKNINCYFNFNNVKETYLKLLDSNTRDNIIYEIVSKKLWENEELMHQIDNIYVSQLTKTYKPYKEIYQEQQRQEREILKELHRQEQERIKQEKEAEKHKYDYLLNNGEELQPVKKKHTNLLIYGLGIPALATYCFTKNIMKPRNKRRH